MRRVSITESLKRCQQMVIASNASDDASVEMPSHLSFNPERLWSTQCSCWTLSFAASNSLWSNPVPRFFIWIHWAKHGVSPSPLNSAASLNFAVSCHSLVFNNNNNNKNKRRFCSLGEVFEGCWTLFPSRANKKCLFNEWAAVPLHWR